MIVPRRRTAAGFSLVEMRQIFGDLLRPRKVAPSAPAKAPAQSPLSCRYRSLLQRRPPRNSLRVKDFPHSGGDRAVADGRKARWKVGEVRLEVDGRSVTTLVLLGKKGTQPLLGAYSLEGLGLSVDSRRRRLARRASATAWPSTLPAGGCAVLSTTGSECCRSGVCRRPSAPEMGRKS